MKNQPPNSYSHSTKLLDFFKINIATKFNSNTVFHLLMFIIPTTLSKHASFSSISMHGSFLSGKLKAPFPQPWLFWAIILNLFCLNIHKTDSYKKMLPSHLCPDWSNIYLYTKLTHKCIIVVLCSSAPIKHFETL